MLSKPSKIFPGTIPPWENPVVTPTGNLNFVQPVLYMPPVQATLPAYKATELYKMPLDQFADLARRVESEARRRSCAYFYPPTVEVEYERKAMELREAAAKAKKNDHVTAFQSFLMGVAHAQACRAALRWSAGHVPYGTAAMDGHPWNAYDGAKLSHMVNNGESFYTTEPNKGKEWMGTRCWSNPLLWTTVGDLKHWLSTRTTLRRPEYLH